MLTVVNMYEQLAYIFVTKIACNHYIYLTTGLSDYGIAHNAQIGVRGNRGDGGADVLYMNTTFR